jgi:hypothetical protein
VLTSEVLFAADACIFIITGWVGAEIVVLVDIGGFVGVDG